LASIITDHANAASKVPTKQTIHQIASIIKNNVEDGRPNPDNAAIPTTIVTAAPSKQQPTNVPNASSFSVPLKHSSKLPSGLITAAAASSYRQQGPDVNANDQTSTTRDVGARKRLLNSSGSVSSTSIYMDGIYDSDRKPVANNRTSLGNEKSGDENENSEDQLKRHVSDEMSKITNSNESCDRAVGVKRKESAVLSHKAKELEKIKEEARILAQYAEFSRRVLEKKGAQTKASPSPRLQNDNENTSPSLQNDNENTKTNTDSPSTKNEVTVSEPDHHVNEHLQAATNIDIDTRVKELEMIKDQARQIASRTRKIIAEDVPEVLTTHRAHPYSSDEIDVSSVSDPTMLFESVRNQSHDDEIPNNPSNDIHAIRDEARRIAQYTYQIIAGPGVGNNSISKVATRRDTDPGHNNESLSIPVNANNTANSKLDEPNDSFPTEVIIAEDAEIAEDEARIIVQYEQYSNRMQNKTMALQNNVHAPQSPNVIDSDTHDNVSPVANATKVVEETDKDKNSNDSQVIPTKDVPLDRLNSLGEVISEERAKELARIKEEARLLALQVRRPTKGVKRLSNGVVATHTAKPPEMDYVVNPDADRSLLDTASSSKIQYVTWKDVLGDSIWATADDVGVAADSVLISLAQFTPCRLREDDRSGRYSHIEIGYIGICCKHCYGQAGYGRYFPTTLPSFISSFPSTVVKHILDDCIACPKLIKDTVNEVERVNQRSALRCSTHCGSKGLMHFVWESIRNTKPEEINAYEEQKRRRKLHAPIGIMSYDVTWEELLHDGDIAAIEDEALVPSTFLALWGQYEKCISDETDCNRTGRLRAHTTGYIGYCCRHCKGEPYMIGSRLFPTNLIALQQPEFIDRMRTHVNSDCPSCPNRIRSAILELEANERIVLPPRHGSKKVFFRRIWKRLHNANDPDDDVTNANMESIQSIAESSALIEPDVADIPIIQELIRDSIIVTMNERGLVPDVVLVAYGQLQPCRLEQMDKAGWYKDREIGFPGLCCKHCGGRPSSGRYFPKTGDNFLRSSKHSIIRHLIELCTNCPDNVRAVLQRLQHKDALKADFKGADEAILGAGKNFHHLLWVRLYKHYNVPHGYYEAIDYSLKAKVKSISRYSKINEPSPNTSSPYVKKRKVDYGRSNPHRKMNEHSNC
jgi:hypothetical protein